MTGIEYLVGGIGALVTLMVAGAIYSVAEIERISARARGDEARRGAQSAPDDAWR